CWGWSSTTPASRRRRTATTATDTWPGNESKGHGHAAVQPLRLDAQSHGVRRRAAADLRIGGARGGVPEHAGPGGESGEGCPGPADLPVVSLLQRLLRPDTGPLQPRVDRPPAAGGRGGLDHPGGALL